MNHSQWAVIGAGPAGIAAVGQLLDAQIPPEQIVWIDPAFTVGDFGTVWKKVLSNTPVESFLKFYHAFRAFEFDQPHPAFMIERLKPEDRCPLMLAAQPLAWITERLRHKVRAQVGTVVHLHHIENGWQLQLASGQTLHSTKVVLAIGAEALTLPYPKLQTIPLTIAANPTLLQQAVGTEDTIAVFGSYQSARTVQEHLAKTQAQKIIHFYRSERSFEQNVASLKLGSHVEVYPITPQNLLTHIPRCAKVIYAVGFQRRALPIHGLPDDFGYDANTGEIAPGLFGIGIAFPEIIPHTMGRLEYKVTSIWPFIKRAQKIGPYWLCDQPMKTHAETTPS